MKLYGYFRSSCSYRVRVALGLKGVAYEYVAVSLIKDGGEQHLPAFLQKNAMAQVPILEVDGEHLSQSVAILEYLEERFPSPALLPPAPIERARVRHAVEIINSGVQPMQNLATMAIIKGLGGDAQAIAKAANERGLAALEQIASQHGGARLVGDRTTLADVCLVPQMYSARRFGVDLTAFPRLTAIDADLATVAAVAAAHPDRQPDAPAA